MVATWCVFSLPFNMDIGFVYSNAAIPISSASSYDRRSRADIAASFQVAICMFCLCLSPGNLLIMYFLFFVSIFVLLLYLFLPWYCFHAASCCITSRRKVPASNWMGFKPWTFHKIFGNVNFDFPLVSLDYLPYVSKELIHFCIPPPVGSFWRRCIK